MSGNIQVSPSHIEETMPSNERSAELLNQSISYQLCLPIIRLGQVLGLISLNINQVSVSETGKNVWNRRLMWLYKSAIAVFTIFVVMVRTKMAMEGNYDSMVSMLVENAVGILEITFLLIVFGYFILEEKRFCSVLQLLLHQDALLRNRFQIGRIYFKLYTVQVLFTVITSLSLLMIHAVNSFIGYKNVVEIISVCLINASSLFLAVIFIIFVFLCSECFASVNEDLNSVLSSQSPIVTKHLEQFQLRYEQIYQIVASVQFAFSSLITAELAHLTALLCLDSYSVLTSVDFKLQNVPLVLGIITHTYRVFAISSATDKLANQATLGLKTLHNIHPKILPYPEGFEIIVFLSNKLSQAPIEIAAAWNLFRVNMNTFTTIMVTLLTYLIVLIQFRTPILLDDLQGNNTNLNTAP